MLLISFFYDGRQLAKLPSAMIDVEQPPAPPSLDGAPSPPSVSIAFTHHGTSHTLELPSDATITDLSSKIESDLEIPTTHQKYMITPKLGLLKPPFANPHLPVTSLSYKKIVLLAPTASEISSISRPALRAVPHSNIKPATPARSRDWKKAQEEATYTFNTIIPLPYLPNPDRSKKFLQRLADDPGIKSAMRKHRFRVGVLTEMDPSQHTTHESRTLGLNRNAGEVIELRLRTDAYDGYRDYKIIRDTLCHELAHNVHGPHDRDFWDLCKAIEREVKAADWKSGGQAVSEQIYYDASDPEERGGHVDGGGWQGGKFVLGGSTAAAGGRKGDGAGGAIGRREAMAKAAEERMKKEKGVGFGGAGEKGS